MHAQTRASVRNSKSLPSWSLQWLQPAIIEAMEDSKRDLFARRLRQWPFYPGLICRVNITRVKLTTGKAAVILIAARGGMGVRNRDEQGRQESGDHGLQGTQEYCRHFCGSLRGVGSSLGWSNAKPRHHSKPHLVHAASWQQLQP